MEDIGATALQSLMTLAAFVPILFELSKPVKALPILGEVPHAMVLLTITWALLGTVGLAVVGMRLPGLEFQNQLVEAAFRKELVFGEDSEERAKPEVVEELFASVRASYFQLFFNFMYFDFAKWSYLQFGVIIPYLALVPCIADRRITLGQMQRLVAAFSSVERSLQFLVRNWAQTPGFCLEELRLHLTVNMSLAPICSMRTPVIIHCFCSCFSKDRGPNICILSER